MMAAKSSSSGVPRQAIVTKNDGTGVRGLAQIQGVRIIIHDPVGGWHNYALKDCVVIWDPERRRSSGNTKA
jgi:hypothetical protein